MLSNNFQKSNIKNTSAASQSQSSSEFIDLNLSEYFLKVKRRWKPALAIFLFTLGVAAILSVLQRKTYQAEGQLLFKRNSAAALTDVVGEKVGTLEPLLVNQTPLSTQIEVITSEPVLQQVIDRLKLKDDAGEPIDPQDLEKKLSIDLVGGSDVVDITYKDADPKLASNVVNTLMDVYLQQQVRNNQSEPATARNFIDRQLPNVETKVSQAESNLESFRTKNNIVDIKEEKRNMVSDLGAINQQISTTGSELQGVNAQASALQSQLGLDLQQAIAINQLGSSPVVVSILDQLTTTETQLAKERQRFKDNHPSVASLEEKKASLNGQLEEIVAQSVGRGVNVSQGVFRGNELRENQLETFISLKIEELSLQRQVGALYSYQQNYLQRAKQLPSLEKKEQELLRKVESSAKTYTTLLDSLQQAKLAEVQQSSNAEIVELASVPKDGSSGRLPLLALGAILGAFLANVSIILLEMQDRSLKSVGEIKKKFPYNVLGITRIDTLSDRGKIIVREEPDSYSSEVYRMIQANLKFLTVNKAPKVMLVTSSVPEEGKSTVAANLAAALAQLDRKVLLIDGDLRRPSQPQLWGIDGQIGLRDVLAGERDLVGAVSRPMTKLDVLTTGKIVSNPLAAIDSPEMDSLVANARRKYDSILIDAPPLPVTADVLTLSKLVDGIIFITRPGVVERESAEIAIETLESTRQKVLGMVINGVKPDEFDRYSYHARYGKRYFNNANNSTNNADASKVKI
ncbi:polysaccharide biosynthesis tyrosine autokinase [Myxosarcina sp. GI1]|uniref:GumC family protein n=1 Tax=Myxosarcina sp. GI1 TaxID=1541065 RepID=UPI00068C6C4B|nr:polysaccharide biosynthesis tyrosine autokinase [Myxosarcina sp. GI1]